VVKFPHPDVKLLHSQHFHVHLQHLVYTKMVAFALRADSRTIQIY
jgi:hypothetical protein